MIHSGKNMCGLYDKYNSLIFTTDPMAQQAGLNEIRNYFKNILSVNIIEAGVAQITFDDNFKDVLQNISVSPPIFIRHIFPVLAHSGADTVDNMHGKIMSLLLSNMEYMDTGKTFSIQNYVLPSMNHEALVINKTQIASQIASHGFELDVTSPEQVVTVMASGKGVYIGISLAKDNMSDWPGGQHRFSKKENFISRAEFKLLEAIAVFKPPMPDGGIALDLGAAPGGWTRVLRKYGMTVHAVDPGDLHDDLLDDEKVVHYKKTAQKFFSEAVQYDIIVNDMKIDIKESIAIMDMAESYLKEDGFCVLTLKLKKEKWQSTVKNAIGLLQKRYNVVGARQLFNNRSEVTVVLQKRRGD